MDQLRSAFLAIQILINSKKHFDRATNHSVGLSILLQKISGCNTGLNSAQTIIMPARPCLDLLKTSGML